MPKTRITKTIVDQIPFTEAGQLLVRDTVLPGFGLRVGRSAKTYFAEGQVRRRTIRTTIGRADLMTPDVARRQARLILAEMAVGRDPRQQRSREALTVDRAYDLFFEAKLSLAPKTKMEYRRSMTLHLSQWKRRPMGEITRQMVLKRHRQISERVGGIMANNVFRHFRSVYNFSAATRDDLPPNPVDILKQARAWNRERRRRTIVPAHLMPQWWRAVMAETEDARDILLIGVFTGMRRSEVCCLRWENVDLVGRQLHVPTTKNGDPLDLPLAPFVVDLISARREWVGQSEWVFPGRGATGHIAETKSFTRRVSVASGVPFSMHDLRRTFITIAESLDIPTYALKRLLNHRTDADITGGYIVMDAERLRSPIERVATKILELADAK